MLLSTAARVQARTAIDAADTANVALLDAILARVSQQVERLLNRDVTSTTHTEQFDVAIGQREFWLPAYPITSVTTIHSDIDRAFGAETLLDSDDYYFESASGLLSLDVPVVPGRGVLQVVYIGGMAANAAAFVTAFPDLAEAVDEQVSHVFKRLHNPGLASESFAGGSVSIVSDGKLLPSVREIVRSHRRRAHV